MTGQGEKSTQMADSACINPSPDPRFVSSSSPAPSLALERGLVEAWGIASPVLRRDKAIPDRRGQVLQYMINQTEKMTFFLFAFNIDVLGFIDFQK